MLSHSTRNDLAAVKMPTVGSLGKIIDSDLIQELIRRGAKLRIKSTYVIEKGGFLDSHSPESIRGTRLIISMPGVAGFPGRRLAEICSTTIDEASLESPLESKSVIVYGPKRSLFHRERIFQGQVSSWEEAMVKLEKIREQT